MSFIIEKSSRELGSLLPDASVFLRSYFACPLYNTAYKKFRVRHPLGTYSISMLRVLEAFDAVLPCLVNFPQMIPWHDISKYAGYPTLVASQSYLLHSLASHLDDCETIICSFIEPTASGNPTKHADRCIEQFRSLIEPYRDHVRSIVNCIKHEQGRLRLVVNDNPYATGYYVEGVDDNANPGPHPVIHKDYPVFSFARDLRYHFIHLYDVSQHLLATIQGIIGANGFVLPAEVSEDFGPFVRIADLLTKLPIHIFKPEGNLDAPWIELKIGLEDTKLILSHASTNQLHFQEVASGRLLIEWRGDGVSKTFRLPYRPKDAFPEDA